MWIKDYLPQDGIVVESFEDAVEIQKILLKNGNAVMITQEEQFWIINWIWCQNGYADRNDVIFINRSEYEWEAWAWKKNHPEYVEEEDDES